MIESFQLASLSSQQHYIKVFGLALTFSRLCIYFHTFLHKLSHVYVFGTYYIIQTAASYVHSVSVYVNVRPNICHDIISIYVRLPFQRNKDFLNLNYSYAYFLQRTSVCPFKPGNLFIKLNFDSPFPRLHLIIPTEQPFQ